MAKKQQENFFQHVSASADFLSTGNNKMDILAPIAECCRRKASHDEDNKRFLFSRLQVYKSREEMLLALPLISDGVISLDGGMITPNGFVSLRNRFQLSLSAINFSFDVGEERFGSVPSPAINDPYAHDSVGVLGEELCITTVLEYGAIHVWTMKDNSTDKGWSKVFNQLSTWMMGHC
ncbi:uncharacterized protein [Euphorbia lathyris]|uniref:uncharacterized protein isoform X3 n=1 Tax=Euphorbia lathyris TaxID=212925 RepID=UPI003313C7AE